MRNLFKPLLLLGLCTSILLSCTKTKDEPIPEETGSLGLSTATSTETQGIELAPYLFLGTLPESYFINMPPVRNQGQQGSCVSWATGYATATLFMNRANGTNYQTDNNLCSPKYIYNQITQGNCSGTSYPANLNILLNKGVCTWTDMPYTDTECSVQPNTTQHTKASTNKILRWELVNKNNITNIKTLLYANLPVMIAVNVDASFDNLQSPYIWKAKSGSVRGGHAITVTGYDNAKNAFKVMNSWGENWKDNGYLWIDYDFFPSAVIGNECYVAYPKLNPAPTDNLTNGLVLNMPFSGNTQDISGNNNHGTNSGATLTTDRKGNANSAYNFNGTSNFIEIADNATLRPEKITISAWVKTTNINSMVLGKTNFTDASGEMFSFGFAYEQNGFHWAIKQDVNCLPGNGWQICYSAPKLNDNTWHHIVGTFDGTKMTLYADGKIVGTKANVASNKINNCVGGKLTIGRWWQGQTLYFGGTIDDIRIYNRALTETEIQQLYNL